MIRCVGCGHALAEEFENSSVAFCINPGCQFFFDKKNTVSIVNHPPHYGGEASPYEAIKVIEAWDLGFALGNAVKYICRAGRKGSEIEDLEKAKWYLERRIGQLRDAAVQRMTGEDR